MDIAERLGRYTYALDGHLLWGGATDSGGYGHLSIGGQLLSAHRVAWELENGLIPEGTHVLHHCDIPPCLEPTHLFLGTPLDNNHDMRAKGRWKSGNSIKTHCSQGPDEVKVFPVGHSTMPLTPCVHDWVLDKLEEIGA